MKLRKALEKAEKIREVERVSEADMHAPRPEPEASAPSPGQMEPPEAVTAGMAFKPAPDEEGPRWTPPVYSTSANLPANYEVLRENRCVGIEPDSPEAECYKFLRAKIQYQAMKNDLRTVLITSPIPGDGKTLTAVNLALIMARAYDQTVLLVDCDLKRQGVHKLFGIRSDSGLQHYLTEEASLEKTIVWPGIEKLSFISGGDPISNSAEVLGAPRMKVLVKELKQRYEDRIVLFDAPPVLSGADTLALTSLVDGIVMVVSEGKTTMKDVRQAMESLQSDKLIGFVMNRQKSETLNGYYYNL